MIPQFDEYDSHELHRLGEVWELRLPERPRFVQDVLRLRVGDTVHIFAGTQFRLAGGAVDWVLSTLVPLLDGSRTVPELAARAKVDQESLLDVLELLHLHGLLEEGESARGPASYFSRHLRLTGAHRNARGALERLSACAVDVVGPEAATTFVARRLGELGVAVWPGGSSPVDLRIAIIDGDTGEFAPADYPTLNIDLSVGTIGPLTVARGSACPTCARIQRQTPPPANPCGGSVASRRLRQHGLLAAGVTQAIGFLSCVWQPRSLDYVESWGASGIEPMLHRTLRLPACPTCGVERVPKTASIGDHGDSLALLYHRAAELKPWDMHAPAAYQGHLTAAVKRLVASVNGALAGKNRIALAGRHDRLARVLRLAGGGETRARTDGGQRFLRYTASAGNLGSAAIHLIAATDRFVPSGVYEYDGASDSLVPREAASCESVLSALDIPTRAELVMLVIADVGRVSRKYGGRGYLYCSLDGGVMLHRLFALARAAGFRATSVSCSHDDEDVAAALRLTLPGKVPMGAVLLETGNEQ